MDDARILTLGKQVIVKERQGLERLEESLNNSFIEAVHLLKKCSGKVILTGMGKSGHVATKAAATIASTGTPSIFLHPAEASHGDLGMIEAKDVVIALSNSGETQELGDIISYCHQFNIPLIALTQNPKSNLARHATLVLITPKAPEACPIELAPSTSTTMMLALMDALALTLHAVKGFTPKDFKKYHPGGKLGSVLVTVADIMVPRPQIPIANVNTPIREVVILMSQGRLGCVCIIDQNAHVGLITDGDLRRHMASEILEQPAKKIMTPAPKSIRDSELAADALRVMRENKITSLLVLDAHDDLVGIIDIHKCLSVGLGSK
jgi:arabinose-5-phosphate isomerase